MKVRNNPNGLLQFANAIQQPAHGHDELSASIEQRVSELYVERGYRHSCALEDCVDAEREMLNREPPVYYYGAVPIPGHKDFEASARLYEEIGHVESGSFAIVRSEPGSPRLQRPLGTLLGTISLAVICKESNNL